MCVHTSIQSIYLYIWFEDYIRVMTMCFPTIVAQPVLNLKYHTLCPHVFSSKYLLTCRASLEFALLFLSLGVPVVLFDHENTQ